MTCHKLRNLYDAVWGYFHKERLKQKNNTMCSQRQLEIELSNIRNQLEDGLPNV